MADTKPKTTKDRPGKDGAPAPAGGGKNRAKIVSNPHPVDELYIDGIAGVLGRSNVCKLDCYRVVGIDREDNNAEIRRITHRLVLPTSALPELIHIIKALSEAGEHK
jgi:hypothetical protein